MYLYFRKKKREERFQTAEDKERAEKIAKRAERFGVSV